MKIAILIDYLEGRGGGEKLVSFMAKKYNADIFVGYANWDRILPEFKQLNVKIIADKITSIPLLKQEQLIKCFSELDLSKYSTVICLGYYSIYAHHKNKIWYSYGLSPIFYKKAKQMAIRESLIKKVGSKLWKWRIKAYDKETVRNIGKIVAISEYSKKIIDDYYGVNCMVINPPVDTSKFNYKPNKNYYLIAARLEPGKRVELAIEAFRGLSKEVLFVEGSGSQELYLKSILGNMDNINFIGRVSSEELADYYSECIALITTAFHDEWSMIMVEALASGKPCISVNQGAFPEIINKDTGILVDDTPEGIRAGVRKITPEIAIKMKDACIKRAKEFDIHSFYKKWDGLIE